MRALRRMRLAIALGVLTLGACAPAMVNQASEEQTNLSTSLTKTIDHPADLVHVLHVIDGRGKGADVT